MLGNNSNCTYLKHVKTSCSRYSILDNYTPCCEKKFHPEQKMCLSNTPRYSKQTFQICKAYGACSQKEDALPSCDLAQSDTAMENCPFDDDLPNYTRNVVLCSSQFGSILICALLRFLQLASHRLAQKGSSSHENRVKRCEPGHSGPFRDGDPNHIQPIRHRVGLEFLFGGLELLR